MPTKRRPISRTPRPDTSDAFLAWCAGGPAAVADYGRSHVPGTPEFSEYCKVRFFWSESTFHAAWEAVREWFMAEWRAKHPSEWPHAWRQFELGKASR